MANSKTILVTGGAGYIGSHACKALAANGYVPVAYDNLEHGHEWAVKWGPLEKGDITDSERLAEVIRTHKPNGVIHFAAYAYVGESVEDPAKYYCNNVAGTLNLLETMHSHEIDRIVFSSSCATYGIPQHVPIPIDHPQDPINPYGASKLMVERILRDFDTAYGIRHVALRYFNAAGADPDAEIGEDHDPEPHLIPLIFSAALGNTSAITMFGDDYNTADGTCVRDYIHVTDLADAHVRALGMLQNTDRSESLNLGTGRGYSVKEVIEATESIIGLTVPSTLGPRRIGDPPSLVASVEKSESLMGWKPKHSDLETIILTAWHWQNKNATR